MTEIFDPARPRVRARTSPSTLPAPAGAPPPRNAPRVATHASEEGAATEVAPPPGRPAVEVATPTEVDPSAGAEGGPNAAVAVALRPGGERSEPIRVISMKDHAEAARPRPEEARVPLHVQLRSIAEVAGLHDAPVALGNLAPPRDPRQARARRLRANVLWAGVAIVLACAISLAIWFIAGR